MDNNEFELKKAFLSAHRFEVVFGFLKHLASLGAALWALDIIFAGLKPFIGQNPAAISAFAKVIAAINPSNITGYILAGVCGLGWQYERTGKKRAIRGKSKYQRLVEAGDAYRSSSGLTETGDTPEERE